MKTFAIDTLGCKVNQYEKEQIIQFLTASHLSYVPKFGLADLIIIHTCCVTASASAKSRHLVRSARSKNPTAKIIVSGCLVKSDSGEMADFGEKIYFASDISELLKLLQTEFKLGNSDDNCLSDNILIDKFTGHSRAFLKVQDGCDGFCSYCIIPRTRPVLHSKPVELAVAEAEKLVSSGYKELVLTGIFLGAYGLDTVKRSRWQGKTSLLPQLLAELAAIKGLERIRLSSLEPADLTEPLLEVMQSFGNIMPHLHLSLQSGSDVILKKMNRQYTAEAFLQSVELANRYLPQPAITTDIIVGFPGETVQDFAATLSVAKLAGFSKIHIFPFSRRRGTAADKLRNQISSQVKSQRISQLRQLELVLSDKFRRQFLGRQVYVLVEDEQSKSGLCQRYYEVSVQTSQPLHKGDIVECMIDLTDPNKGVL